VHRRQYRRDDAATKAAAFLCPRYSYISRRIHPGSDPPHQCQYLAGDDVGVMRERIFKREEGRCWNCGAYYGLNYGELRHLVGGDKYSRCWCPENLGWGCPKCHRIEHNREPKWGESAKRSAGQRQPPKGLGQKS